ncbi:MAG: DUF1579 domain-containing protein [Acidobacteria bacterium]|nr:DUF1579 domain-containing protein [Acidobacteriota bacterium]MBI3489945.1 DUF1579 domain-containing protein [Acidobacteriota bacterium]
MRHALLISTLALACALPLCAQDNPFPKPTPHHLAMKDQAGTWRVVAKMYMEPGKPPMVSKGIETNALVAGGLWLKTEMKSEMMGMPFEGYGLSGYDTQANAHVGSWVDSSGTWMALVKGTCSKDCKEQTLLFDGYDEAGKPSSHKEVHTQVDRDHRAMVMYAKGKDGAYVRLMELEYTRAK